MISAVPPGKPAAGTLAVFLALLAVLLSACEGAQAAPVRQGVNNVPDHPRKSPSKVLVMMEENHSATQAEAGMPYLMRRAYRYGYDANFHAVGNPSLPNYLAIAGGSTFGITDDDAPSVHPIHAITVFDQALKNGKTATTFNESMPSACDRRSSNLYAVKHNPWPYFVRVRSRQDCTAHAVRPRPCCAHPATIGCRTSGW